MTQEDFRASKASIRQKERITKQFEEELKRREMAESQRKKLDKILYTSVKLTNTNIELNKT